MLQAIEIAPRRPWVEGLLLREEGDCLPDGLEEEDLPWSEFIF